METFIIAKEKDKYDDKQLPSSQSSGKTLRSQICFHKENSQPIMVMVGVLINPNSTSLKMTTVQRQLISRGVFENGGGAHAIQPEKKIKMGKATCT